MLTVHVIVRVCISVSTSISVSDSVSVPVSCCCVSVRQITLEASPTMLQWLRWKGLVLSLYMKKKEMPPPPKEEGEEDEEVEPEGIQLVFAFFPEMAVKF